MESIKSFDRSEPKRKDSQTSKVYKSTHATIDGIEEIRPEDREFLHRDSHDLEAFQSQVSKAFSMAQVLLIAPLLLASMYVFTMAQV